MKKNLVADFESLFGGQYLERGKEYYKHGLVKILLRDKNLITAKVEGNSLYSVSIDLDSGEMSCSCPCDENCKHLAAVFYALRANKANDADKLFAPLKTKPKEELVETIKAMVLENPELSIYINTDDSVLEKEIRELWFTDDEYEFETKTSRLHNLIIKKPKLLDLELKLFRKLFDIFDHYGGLGLVEGPIFKVLGEIKKELKKPENKNKKKEVLKGVKQLVKDYDYFLDAIE